MEKVIKIENNTTIIDNGGTYYKGYMDIIYQVKNGLNRAIGIGWTMADRTRGGGFTQEFLREAFMFSAPWLLVRSEH